MCNNIYFYSSTKDYAWLSNFQYSPMTIDGILYPSNEHYYQSEKVCDIGLRYWLIKCPNPKYLYLATRLLKKTDIKDNWEQIKFAVMLKGLREKFKQNPELKQKLLDTGDSILHEDSSDKVWGKDGKDMLGKLLMKVREEIREEELKKTCNGKLNI